MIVDLEVIRPAGRLFRVSRVPDPWAWPAWEYAGADGTFGNRWDDPQAVYRVLYACSELQGCFVEVLSRFRPDESGNLTFKPTGSKYYVFTAAWTYDPAPLANDLTGLRFALLKQGHAMFTVSTLPRIRRSIATLW
jgi:hypothetical protein